MMKFRAFLTKRNFIGFTVLAVLLLVAFTLISCNDVVTINSQAKTNSVTEPSISSSDAMTNNSLAETTAETLSLLQSQIIAAPNEYSWVTETYEETPTAWIQYPVIHGLKNKALEDNINSQIKAKAFDGWEGLCLPINYECEYEVKLANSSFISISYKIFVYGEGPSHPMHEYHTINLDLQTGEEILLSEFYDINEAFIDVIQTPIYYADGAGKEVLDEENIFVVYGSKNEPYCVAFRNAADDLSSQSTLRFYYTKDKLGYVHQTFSMLGGYFILEIPYTALTDFERPLLSEKE